MTDPVKLHGYRYSVYNRAARLALLSKQVEYETVEINPFEKVPDDYLKLHPFVRVPVLTHGTFTLFETGAITRYVDRAFAGEPLQPEDPMALARMDQVISVIDTYAYWPMVRQVFSHGYFQARQGESADPEQVQIGLEASARSLAFFDDVASEGQILTGSTFTLADCHLVPMVDYFARAEPGKAALARYPAVQAWWDKVSALDVVQATDPLA